MCVARGGRAMLLGIQPALLLGNLAGVASRLTSTPCSERCVDLGGQARESAACSRGAGARGGESMRPLVRRTRDVPSTRPLALLTARSWLLAEALHHLAASRRKCLAARGARMSMHRKVHHRLAAVPALAAARCWPPQAPLRPLSAIGGRICRRPDGRRAAAAEGRREADAAQLGGADCSARGPAPPFPALPPAPQGNPPAQPAPSRPPRSPRRCSPTPGPSKPAPARHNSAGE